MSEWMSDADLRGVLYRTLSKVNDLTEKLPLYLSTLIEAQAELLRRERARSKSNRAEPGAGVPPDPRVQVSF